MHAPQDPLIIIYVTTPNLDSAQQIGKSLINKHLAACTNIFPAMHSQYLWQGEFTESQESVLLIKTSQSRFQDVTQEIKSLHEYQTPCIISWPLGHLDNDYEKWLRKSISQIPPA